MNDALHSELFRDVEKIWLRELHERPPELVWHHTKGETLEKILESNCVRATSIRHVNDQKEFRYGKDLVEEILGQRQFERHDLGPILDDLRRRIDLFDARTDVFVFCASEESDCKSQWHRYGEDGKGYSLGFISSRLNGWRIRKPHDLRWCRVEYERSMQLYELGEVIDCY
jgi:hypothetical protein